VAGAGGWRKLDSKLPLYQSKAAPGAPLPAPTPPVTGDKVLCKYNIMTAN